MKKAEFIVPDLTIDAEYKSLVERRAALHDQQARLRTERKRLEREIADAPATTYSAGVAALLGEDQDSTSGQRARLAAMRREESDIDTAVGVVARRIAERQGPASRAVVAQCRTEYRRRVAAVVAALQTVQAARAEYDDLRDQFEANDIAWTSLGPLSLGFLGDQRDGHIDRLVQDAREAGYVS